MRPPRMVLVSRAAVLAACLVVPATSARAADRPKDPFAPAEVLASVKTLADTAWTGRGAGTPGLEKAAQWIAHQFAAAGLVPGGDDGTWFQSFEIQTGVELAGVNRLETRRGGPWKVGEDVQPLGWSASGTLAAPFVFAGYGITAPEYDYDDYRGVDAKDRIVLVLRDEPGADDPKSRFEGKLPTVHSELRHKAINAREHGAVGLLVVYRLDDRDQGEPLPRLRADAAYMSAGLSGWAVSRAVADSMLARHGLNVRDLAAAIDAHGAPYSLAFPDTVTLEVNLARKSASAKNVIGRRPGSKKGTALVVGAHYDHLGLGGESSMAESSYGQVHPGADDNASGTAAMLAMAESRARPLHDRWYVAFAGEEVGLVGSSWFVDHPPVPLADVRAMINFDMVGRLRQDRLMVMGAGTAAEFASVLDATNPSAGKGRFDLKTSADGYGPSDQQSFYKKNLPVLFFFTGAHADYHRPSDTWDRIDADGLSRVARYASAVADSLERRPSLTFTKASADTTQQMTLRGGHGAWLGTIPDYTQTEGGVLLSGVRDNSPAKAAGIQGGDIIVKLDEVKVDNIYDFTFVLQSKRPGDVLHVFVRRGAETKELTATLARRPG